MTDTMADVEFVVRTIAQTAVDNEKEFGELDSVVGDGDFGYSLARGFEKVLAEWDAFDRIDIGTFLKKVGLMVTSRIGGTSGPIWGTGFLRAGAAVAGRADITRQDVVAMLRAAATGISARGGAELGDKTLLDTLIPITDVLDQTADRTDAEWAGAVAQEARRSAEATSALQARRGRAAYTGERSIGSVDAGAMALAIITERIAEQWPGR